MNSVTKSNYRSTKEYRQLIRGMIILAIPFTFFIILFFYRRISHSSQFDPLQILSGIAIGVLGTYGFIYFIYNLKRCIDASAAGLMLDTYGVALDDIGTNIPVNRFSLCLIRGILIFMASYGSIAGLVSAFGISFYVPGVFLGILVVSMLAAFLYYNKITFYLGYFILFFAFTVFAFSLYPYINSGFQSFLNEVYQRYSNFFYLDVVREGNVLIDNRYLTISLTMVFVGLMFAILLNITISAHMNLIETFLITFMPLQIAFYIDIIPSIPYLAMLLAVYITVGILGRSKHYHMSLNMKNEPFFRCKLKKRGIHYSYQSSSRGILTLSLYSIVFCIIFLIIGTGFLYSDFDSKGISNQLKNTTDYYVKTFIQSGMWGFYDRYPSTGGMNNGKLGGAGSVNPDYQTDLEVTFVPYSSDTVYLKGYTGVTYDNNFFASNMSLPENPMSGALSNESFARMQIRFVDFEYTMPDLVIPYDTMQSYPWGIQYLSGIDNVDNLQPESHMNLPESPFPAMENQAYTEAFKLWDDTMADYNTNTNNIFIPDGYEYEVLYIPYISSTYYEPNPAITEEYESTVYENYLQIPEYLNEVLADFCDEAELTELLAMVESAVTYEEKQQARLGIASRLKSYFAREFPYTMSPGTTPRDRDAIEYFLTEQRRGFCAHFASSSTLILRYMGIPARYVEGYCIHLSDLMEADAISSDTTGWYIGENDLPDTGLVTVEVSDGSAHAWVEIYLDGYGWIPFEMTPPAFGDTVDNAGLLTLFSGLFTPAQRMAEGAANITEAGQNFELPLFSFVSSVNFVAQPLFILLAALLGIFLFMVFHRPALQYIRKVRFLHQSDYSSAALLSYCSFVRKLQKSHFITEPYPLIRDVGSFLKSSAKDTSNLITVDEWIGLSETAAFGRNTISEEQYKQFCQFNKKVRFEKKGKTAKNAPK